MKRSASYIFPLITIPLDYLSSLAAFSLSYGLRQKINLDPRGFGNWSKILQIEQFESLPEISFYLNLSLVISFFVIATFALLGLYRANSAILRLGEFSKIIIGVSVGIAAIILLGFFLRTYLLPRLIILLFWLLAIFLITAIRTIVRIIQRSLYRYDIGLSRIAVFGSNGLAADAEKEIKRLKLSGYSFYKRYENREKNQLISDIKKGFINQVLIADYSIEADILNQIRETCIDIHVRFTYIPNIFEVSTSRVETRDLNGLPIIEVKPTPLDGYGRVIKRITDLILSTIAIIILSPLMLLTAILIKIIIPGPVFFRHERLGIAGRKISILKFRSLNYIWCDHVVYKGKTGLRRLQEYLDTHPDAAKEWREKQKLQNDPRVLPFGNFLRKINLDELPQFFNVLLGDLSLVGPRPIIEKEKERYGQLSSRLFSVKPGLTGLWQVSGRSDLTYEERVRLDILYVENWSFWWDMAILLKTVEILFRRQKGAY